MASSLLMKPTVTCNKDEVYVAAVPLRATKGPAQFITSTAYSLNLWDLQHFMVIIKPSSPPPHSQALFFLLGVILTRRLSKLPRTKCWFVGSSKAGAIDIAREFNKGWETHLRVGHHDCRNYTNASGRWETFNLSSIVHWQQILFNNSKDFMSISRITRKEAYTKIQEALHRITTLQGIEGKKLRSHP
uniref:uncharacterized protein LOC101296647 isoform X2 n=1 Tax=Fragaria vesca subsp. vesca TaxID=101020 RepID=UPI0005CA4E1B|nr:PREDICTED: uncharacterized protein LOC101296647 isoform X2 [Fragaria vesca subsp. vesca]